MAGAAALVLALTACTPATEPTPTAHQQTGGLPSSHVHGLAVSGDTSQVLLATHDGLFDVTKEPATKIGVEPMT